MKFTKGVILFLALLLAGDAFAQVQGISGEARFQGARRVRNLVGTVVSASSEDMTSSGWTNNGGATHTATTVTFGASGIDGVIFTTATSVAASDKTFTAKFRVSAAATKNVRIILGQPGVGDIILSSNIAVGPVPVIISITGTAAAGAGTGAVSAGVLNGSDAVAGTVTVTNCQIEDVTGQTNQNPSEYVSVGVLSSPYHGTYVDGEQLFPYANTNTVSSNVVSSGISLVHGNIMDQM